MDFYKALFARKFGRCSGFYESQFGKAQGGERWATVYGDIISITNAQGDTKSLKVTLEPIQGGSGTPSPDNICPISGRTECVTEVCGKNLLNPTFSDWSTAGTYLHINDVLPTETTARMTFIDKDTSVSIAGLYVGWVYEDVTATGAGHYNWCIENGTKKTNTLNESANIQDTKICRNIFIYPNTQEAFDKLFARYDIQVELGSTATSYEPYQGNTYTTTLGRTVYGGTLDVVTGELVVDRAIRTLNGSENWSYNATTGNIMNVTIPLSDTVNFSDNTDDEIRVVSDKMDGVSAKTATSSATRKSGNIAIISSKRLYASISTDIAPTTTEFANWVRENPITIVYELATPQTYQLTPTEVQLLLGTNNVWSDGGIRMVYRRR